MEMRERGWEGMHNRNAAWNHDNSSMSAALSNGSRPVLGANADNALSRIQSDLLNTALTRAKSLDDVLTGAALAAQRQQQQRCLTTATAANLRSRSSFKDTVVLRSKLQTVTKERDQLAQRLAQQQAENDSKDQLIQSLEQQIAALKVVQQEPAAEQQQTEAEEMSIHGISTSRFRLGEDDLAKTSNHGPPSPKRIKERHPSSASTSGGSSGSRTRTPSPLVPHHLQQQQPFNGKQAVEEIQRWMFLDNDDGDGGHLGVEDMILRYVEHVRCLGVPLDRMYVGSVVSALAAVRPSQMPRAFCWKWDQHQGTNGVSHAVVPRSSSDGPVPLFLSGPDGEEEEAPLRWFVESKAAEECVRINKATATNHSDNTKATTDDRQWWFWKENEGQSYQDYLALPIVHRGEFLGGVTWSTQSLAGFSDQHVQFFKSSLACLSTVLRLHTNDVVMKAWMSGLEEEVADRTSELVAANKNLEAANNRIRKQSEAIVDHFTVMSHNLLTPLNFIVGMSSLLEGSKLDDSQRESVESIIRGGELLARLAEDVLDYSRLELGAGMDLAVRSTSLRDTIETVVEAMEIKAKPRGLQIRVHWEDNVSGSPPLPDVVQTDARRLRQILYNLLGNAVKFSADRGVIDFRISLRGEQDIQFVVKDYGRGIDQCDLASIFEPFSQRSEDTIGAYGGTGLGLAITRKLVQGLGGIISATSELGEWSEFVVSLPIGKAPATCSDTSISSGKNEILSDVAKFETMSKSLQQRPETRTVEDANMADTSTAPLDTIRVLVVDDNKVNQKILQRVLQRLGVRLIDIASDGQEAVDLEATKVFDLILMDIQMPRLDGIDATRLILSRPRSAGELSPRVVFVTAHALDTFRQRALEVGGSDFVCKPINIQKIRAIFESLFPAGEQ